MDQAHTRLYELVRQHAGFLDLSSRVQIEVRGPDRVAFLHSMISHDAQALQENRGRYSTFLTATGKMIADFHFYKMEDTVLIDVAGNLAQDLQQALEKFVIMDDVEFVRLEPCDAQVSLQGPASAGIVRKILEREPPQHRLEIDSCSNPAGWVINRPEVLPSGFQILISGPSDFDLRQSLRAISIPEIPQPVSEILRIEAMKPRFGVDMDQGNNPLEARLDDSYSLTKGCYVGQEVVAKATHVGGVNRLLVGFLSQTDWIPKPGSTVFSGDKKVGKITSSCYSPRLQCPLSLGYLRRHLVEAGVEVAIESDGRCQTARVCLEFPAREGRAE